MQFSIVIPPCLFQKELIPQIWNLRVQKMSKNQHFYHFNALTGSPEHNPEFDAYLYKLRHLVENLFARLKHFRSIATSYEKLARNFKAMMCLACIFLSVKLK